MFLRGYGMYRGMLRVAYLIDQNYTKNVTDQYQPLIYQV
jgi:hypothetical protein